jgi:hypothetical protein
MKYRTIFSVVVVFSVLIATPVYASDLKISPLLIDTNTEARDIITKDITLSNESSAKKNIYITVNEVAVDTTGEVKEFISPAMDDRTTAITSWLEISRARIELEPSETKVVPLTIRVHPQAKPGVYKAFIGFAEASQRPEAESIALRGDAEGVIIKLNLEQEVNDLLHINSFSVEKFILRDEQRFLSLQLENKGDTSVAPKGEVIFYNSRGEEVSSVLVNEQLEVVPAGEKKSITIQIPFSDTFGKFKANVRLMYGADNQAVVFDTAQFFMVPSKFAVGALILVVLLSILLTYLLRRAFYDELHDEEANTLPVYVRNDREHELKDHDINLKK